MGTSTDPVYLRVLEDLRSQSREGVLPPGARVPSRAAIMTRYVVGETAAKHALAVLATEGLIEPRPGSGSYVRHPPVIRRLDHDRPQTPGSPFGLDESALPAAREQAQARRLSWEHHSERAGAPPQIARRLKIQPDDRVMRTKYVLRADGCPVQMATSYEPMEITAGSPLAWVLSVSGWTRSLKTSLPGRRSRRRPPRWRSRRERRSCTLSGHTWPVIGRSRPATS